MRKLYFLLFTVFSLFAVTQTVHSQTVTIGTGTTAQRPPLAYFWGFERSAAIYTAAEMGTTTGAASVVSIAYNTTIAANTGPTVIYFREVGSTTTQTSVTWASKIATATQVYSGTPAVGAVGWRTITLTTPYALNAGQNLEILVECNFTGGGTGSAPGNGILASTVTNGHQAWTNDNTPPIVAGTLTNNRPNIQMVLGPPIVCVAPPGGGVLTGPASPVCPGSPFSLAVTGASFGTGLTYQWQSSPDDVAWTDITGATLAGLTTSQGGVATYYRRKITCSAQDGFSNSVLVTPTAPISTFPWSENFNSVTAGTLPTCTSVRDVNGGTTWNTVANANLTTWGWSAPNALVYGYSTTLPGNDWFFTPGFSLVAGTTYRLRFKYGPTDPLYPERMKVAFGNSPTPAAMTNTIVDYTNIVAPAAAPFAKNSGMLSITPATTGVYHIGFQAYSAADQFNLYLDDIIFDLMPTCFPAESIVATPLTPTSETISWAAPASAPASGYQWEVRTSGVGGSGATGLAASGVTAAGVLTDIATGLVANTAYTLWVRSDCGGGDLSEWGGPVAFRTLCNPVVVLPFTETFEASSPTRSCWKINEYVTGAKDWTYGAGAGNGGVTTAHGGTVNAQFFGAGTGAVTKLVSPVLDLSSLSASGADLTFWYANPNWLGDQNQLRVYYRSSNAAAWTLYPGAVYTSNTGLWTEVVIENIPGISSEYSFAFEGTELFGYGVAIDDVNIKAAPSCRKPTLVSAIGITTTAANVYFTSPGNDFIVEYGAVGFTPGTGATAGPGGTILTATASPVNITGLGVSASYDVYVRRVCVAGTDYSENVKATFTTLCTAVAVPYTQNFESAVVPGFPTCTSSQDVNGNTGATTATGGRWISFTNTADNSTYVSATKSLIYAYDAGNTTRAADDWFYLRGLNLTAGQSYRLKFFYKATDGPDFVEQLEVKYGTEAHGAAMTNAIYSNTSIATNIDNPFDSAQVDFTPTATGVYYIGFHAMSDADQAYLILDDISVKTTPVVDMGVTGLVVPDLTCPPTSPVIVQATIRNYNIVPIDFAAFPITVNASITGSATATLTTTINTGTLAAGASRNVFLNPGFAFAAGLYNITTTTVSASDPEPANNAYTTTINVNPQPAAATVTPSAPQICVGSTVQLNTQFVPITGSTVHPTVSSGTIAQAIPDASAVGTAHTLAVSGIPATASIVSMSVTLNATHTWNSDMVFNLRAPNGNVLNLVNGKGGSGDGYTNAIISSTGTASLPTANTTPVTGTFRPDGVLGVGATGNVSNVAAFTGL